MYTHSNQERVLGVLAGVSCDGDVQVVQGGAGGDRDLGDCDDHDHDWGDRVVQGGGYVEGMGGANCNFRVHNPTSGKFSLVSIGDLYSQSEAERKHETQASLSEE